MRGDGHFAQTLPATVLSVRPAHFGLATLADGLLQEEEQLLAGAFAAKQGHGVLVDVVGAVLSVLLLKVVDEELDVVLANLADRFAGLVVVEPDGRGPPSAIISQGASKRLRARVMRGYCAV